MKFKLTTETKVFLGRTLYRIEAIIDFGMVKAGEKGGFVEADKNLSQEGDAWVSGNAWVYGDARVYGSAWVYGNARVYGSAWVFGDARVYGSAWVYGNARVYGSARVSPINIIGLDYNVTISDAHMMIGCEHHLISEWKSFDDRRIIQMDGARAAKFWNTHGPYLRALCADRPGIGGAK